MSKPIKVAVLEDDNMYNRLIEKAIQTTFEELKKQNPECECLVKCYTNPEVFLADPQEYDFVVLDFYLTEQGESVGMDGKEVLRQIKAKTPNTYVLVLSSQDRLNVVAEVKNEGADSYLMKNKRALKRMTDIFKEQFQSVCEASNVS